ncbi:hypothetical protein ACGF7U_20610 [Micromonospora sp. NPDC047670]|uniref:hypothetical protein n=1 Tax=Micromonospora sp. NPDC047670 TaxID=3364252 RepID=UPI00371B64C8
MAATAPWPALPGPDGAGPASGAGPAPADGAGPGGGVGSGASRQGGPWPALPDEHPLWTVPAADVDDERVRRLDREQAGG